MEYCGTAEYLVCGAPYRSVGRGVCCTCDVCCVLCAVLSSLNANSHCLSCAAGGHRTNVGKLKYILHEVRPLLRPSGCALDAFEWLGIMAVSVILGVFAMGWQSLVMNFMQLCCSRFSDQTQQGDTSGNQPTRKQNKKKTTRTLYNRLT